MANPRIVKTVNVLLVAGILLCTASAGFVFERRKLHSTAALWAYYLGFLLTSLVLAYVLRSNPLTKIRFVLLCVSILISVYAAEIISIVIFQRGLHAESRTKFQVINNFRTSGDEAYPVVNPNTFILTDGLSGIFPLAGISNKRTVFCNESGTFSSYISDAHGFNNPSWEEAPDIVLIGDSFAHGACVSAGDDIGSRLRSGGKTVTNLGSGGSGPLIELAILREYALPLKPKVLLWLYYEGNDLADLSSELESGTLRKFLKDDDFSQHLIDRQANIDTALKTYIDPLFRGEQKEEQVSAKVLAALRLTSLRNRWVRFREQDISLPPPGDDFKSILLKANTDVSRWGGRMYFVYLPSYGRYSHSVNEDDYCHRRAVLEVVRNLQIPVIDVHQLFVTHPDPLSLFANRRLGHYTSEGYRLVAEYIRSKL